MKKSSNVHKHTHTLISQNLKEKHRVIDSLPSPSPQQKMLNATPDFIAIGLPLRLNEVSISLVS